MFPPRAKTIKPPMPAKTSPLLSCWLELSKRGLNRQPIAIALIALTGWRVSPYCWRHYAFQAQIPRLLSRHRTLLSYTGSLFTLHMDLLVTHCCILLQFLLIAVLNDEIFSRAPVASLLGVCFILTELPHVKLNENNLLKPSQMAPSCSWIKCSSCHGLVESFFFPQTFEHVMMGSIYYLEEH